MDAFREAIGTDQQWAAPSSPSRQFAIVKTFDLTWQVDRLSRTKGSLAIVGFRDAAPRSSAYVDGDEARAAFGKTLSSQPRQELWSGRRGRAGHQPGRRRS